MLKLSNLWKEKRRSERESKKERERGEEPYQRMNQTTARFMFTPYALRVYWMGCP